MKRPLFLPWVLLLSIGCGADREGGSVSEIAAASSLNVEAMPGNAAPAENSESAEPAADASARKIIYTAHLDLLVEELGPAVAQVPKLVLASGGYISAQDVSDSASLGGRHGTWTIRVPVDRFESFLESIGGLGEVRRSRRDSKEVTEQFYDTEARLKNKRVQEQRVLKILEEKTGRLEDVLTVEKELSQVRGEAEQLEGSLRMLANVTAMTTVHLAIAERTAPPVVTPKPEPPTFAATVAATFGHSLDVLTEFGKMIVLVAAALAPWIPFLLILAAIAWWMARRPRALRHAPPGDAFYPRP